MANTYLYEKMVATRQPEIRREMHQSHTPAYMRQSPNFAENAGNRNAPWLVEPGFRLQRVEQQARKASI